MWVAKLLEVKFALARWWRSTFPLSMRWNISCAYFRRGYYLWAPASVPVNLSDWRLDPAADIADIMAQGREIVSYWQSLRGSFASSGYVLYQNDSGGFRSKPYTPEPAALRGASHPYARCMYEEEEDAEFTLLVSMNFPTQDSCC